MLAPGRGRDRRRAASPGSGIRGRCRRRRGPRCVELGGLLMPGLVNCHGHSPMTLVRSAGRRAAARALAARGGLAPGGAAGRRGRLLGHGARRGRAAGQRHHHDLRAVPASRRRGRRRCSTPASAPCTPRRSSTCPEAGPEHLGGAARRAPAGSSTRWTGKEERLASGLRPARRLHRAARGAARPSPPRRGAATRCCRSTSPRREAECARGAGALRHQRAGAAGRRRACSRAGCWPRTRCGSTTPTWRCWPSTTWPWRTARAPTGSWASGIAPLRALLERGRAGRSGHRRPGLQRRPPPVGRDAARRRSSPGPPPATPSVVSSAAALRLATRGGGEALGLPVGSLEVGPAGRRHPAAHRRRPLHPVGRATPSCWATWCGRAPATW